MTPLDSTQTPSPGSAEPILPQSEPTRAEQVAQGLEELAGWLRENPDVPVLNASASCVIASSDVAERFAAIVRALGTVSLDNDGDTHLVVWRRFAGGVEFRAQCKRHEAMDLRPEVRPLPQVILDALSGERPGRA